MANCIAGQNGCLGGYACLYALGRHESVCDSQLRLAAYRSFMWRPAVTAPVAT